MGVSTNGLLCIGIAYDEEYQFPWLTTEAKDIETWWICAIHGYKDPFEMFTSEGEWIGGKEWPKDKVSEYFDAIRYFKKMHPLPVEEVLHCSSADPMRIIACKGTVVTANRGCPKKIEPPHVPDCEAMTDLTDFCEKYCPQENMQPAMWLASMWG